MLGLPGNQVTYFQVKRQNKLKVCMLHVETISDVQVTQQTKLRFQGYMASSGNYVWLTRPPKSRTLHVRGKQNYLCGGYAAKHVT